jgi:hypothetical protein
MTATSTKRKRSASPWLSMSQAARELGIDKSTLCEAARKKPLYAPAFRASEANGLGVRACRYHREQIRLILAVLLGLETTETALLRWEIFRRQLVHDDGGMANGK